MSPYCTLHLHNVPAGREAEYAAWFDGPHRKALASLRGLVNADRFEVSPIQIMPDIPQPWRYMSLYEFDLPNAAIDLPALGPLLADARDARSEEHTSELQSLMRISYAGFCLKKKKKYNNTNSDQRLNKQYIKAHI